MTVVVNVRCDAKQPNGEDCWVQDEPPSSPRTATEARARLGRQGWHRTRDGRDICPVCWTAGRR